MDIAAHNRTAWNSEAEKGNPWTVPVTAEEIEQAASGRWEVVLTPLRPVPRQWFGEISGKRILCLASGGGQQGPILAAAGAEVTVFDNSDAQLERDRLLSDRHGLGITTVRGDMRNLGCFPEASFDLIFHPVSNLFVDDPLPVWRECARVVRPGGWLLSGFCNPVIYLFPPDEPGYEDLLTARYPLPYADPLHRRPEELERMVADREPFEFGHTLTQQIGGQLSAGFILVDMFEDSFGQSALESLTDTFIATRARKES